MYCPFCGYENIPGTDECGSCSEDLASVSRVIPQSAFEKILMEDPIRRLKPASPIVVESGTTVLEAVQKMNEKKIGCLLVLQKGDLVGILTERDILHKLAARKQDPEKTTVNEIMTVSPETLREEDTLAYAVNKMSIGGFRHIPVTKNGKAVGIISVRDVLRYLSKLFPTIKTS